VIGHVVVGCISLAHLSAFPVRILTRKRKSIGKKKKKSVSVLPRAEFSRRRVSALWSSKLYVVLHFLQCFVDWTAHCMLSSVSSYFDLLWILSYNLLYKLQRILQQIYNKNPQQLVRMRPVVQRVAELFVE